MYDARSLYPEGHRPPFFEPMPEKLLPFVMKRQPVLEKGARPLPQTLVLRTVMVAEQSAALPTLETGESLALNTLYSQEGLLLRGRGLLRRVVFRLKGVFERQGQDLLPFERSIPFHQQAVVYNHDFTLPPTDIPMSEHLVPFGGEERGPLYQSAPLFFFVEEGPMVRFLTLEDTQAMEVRFLTLEDTQAMEEPLPFLGDPLLKTPEEALAEGALTFSLGGTAYGSTQVNGLGARMADIVCVKREGG